MTSRVINGRAIRFNPTTGEWYDSVTRAPVTENGEPIKDKKQKATPAKEPEPTQPTQPLGEVY